MVLRITLWKNIKKIWNTIKDHQNHKRYERFRCTVWHEISTSDWFLATVRVHICSPFMFLLGIDQLMREVTEGKRGIHWTFTTTLEGEDFADDITIQSHTQQIMQIWHVKLT